MSPRGLLLLHSIHSIRSLVFLLSPRLPQTLNPIAGTGGADRGFGRFTKVVLLVIFHFLRSFAVVFGDLIWFIDGI
jgi:hypothetical protein